VFQKRADAVVERMVLIDWLGGRTRAGRRLDRGGGVLSLRSRRAGDVRSAGGADRGEWESEQGGEPESPEQRGAQVLAFGSAVAEPEQPAVDRVQTQRLVQPKGVGERQAGDARPDAGLQARAERPADPPGRERGEEEDGGRPEPEPQGRQPLDQLLHCRLDVGVRGGADQQQLPDHEHDRGGDAEVRCQTVGAQRPRHRHGDPQAAGQHGSEVHRVGRRQVPSRGRVPQQEDHGHGNGRGHPTGHQEGRSGHRQPHAARTRDGQDHHGTDQPDEAHREPTQPGYRRADRRPCGRDRRRRHPGHQREQRPAAHGRQPQRGPGAAERELPPGRPSPYLGQLGVHRHPPLAPVVGKGRHRDREQPPRRVHRGQANAGPQPPVIQQR
jgi:hypothetical protein